MRSVKATRGSVLVPGTDGRCEGAMGRSCYGVRLGVREYGGQRENKQAVRIEIS